MSVVRKILFVCVENAGRSQMAEGFLRYYAPQFDVGSAGTRPNSALNPIVIQAMKEIGIDITKQKPKELTNEMLSDSIPVNMGCMDSDSCPSLFTKDLMEWNVSDPKNKDIDEVRKIRDKIKDHVLDLIKKLEEQS